MTTSISIAGFPIAADRDRIRDQLKTELQPVIGEVEFDWKLERRERPLITGRLEEKKIPDISTILRRVVGAHCILDLLPSK